MWLLGHGLVTPRLNSAGSNSTCRSSRPHTPLPKSTVTRSEINPIAPREALLSEVVSALWGVFTRLTKYLIKNNLKMHES